MNQQTCEIKEKKRESSDLHGSFVRYESWEELMG
jgi:hypothetical protein